MVRIGNVYVNSIGGYAGWTTLPSDRRFKKNVSENVPGLDFINELRPVTYNMDVRAVNQFLHKDSDQAGRLGSPASDPTKLESESGSLKGSVVYTGFIAQDVEVAAKKIGYDFSGVDAPKNENDFYGLRYAEFVVPLVKAAQELDQKNESLANLVNIQQQSIEMLKKQNEELLLRIEKLESK